MKPSPGTSRSALTSCSISLIVGLGFIIILVLAMGYMGSATYVSSSITAPRLSAHNDETQIVYAVKAYYVEYGKYPIDSAKASGAVVFSTDNNLLFDVLRNRTGIKQGNVLNPRGIVFIEMNDAADQTHPKAGLQASTGIWFDPWGTPYHIAIDGNNSGELNGKTPIPDFYSDLGPVQAGVIAWSYGKNRQLGGGSTGWFGFFGESGTPGKLSGSGDVVFWQ